MIFKWFKILNAPEFLSTNLVSKTYTLNLQDIGASEILVTLGNGLGITYKGVFLLLNTNDQNPFYFDGYSVYKDENDDIYLGIPV